MGASVIAPSLLDVETALGRRLSPAELPGVVTVLHDVAAIAATQLGPAGPPALGSEVAQVLRQVLADGVARAVAADKDVTEDRGGYRRRRPVRGTRGPAEVGILRRLVGQRRRERASA